MATYLKQETLVTSECLRASAIPITENLVRRMQKVPDRCEYCYVTPFADALRLTFSSKQILKTFDQMSGTHRVLDPDADLKAELPGPDSMTRAEQAWFNDLAAEERMQARLRNRKPDIVGGMSEYTKWWTAHPWHVTKGMAVPPDCDCDGCKARRAREASEGTKQNGGNKEVI